MIRCDFCVLVPGQDKKEQDLAFVIRNSFGARHCRKDILREAISEDSWRRRLELSKQSEATLPPLLRRRPDHSQSSRLSFKGRFGIVDLRPEAWAAWALWKVRGLQKSNLLFEIDLLSLLFESPNTPIPNNTGNFQQVSPHAHQLKQSLNSTVALTQLKNPQDAACRPGGAYPSPAQWQALWDAH